MSIRPSHHNFAGNTQNTSVARMQKMRERFNRWEHKANERRSMFIERQKARVERYRDAFRGSWISKIGLGMVAIWNFITNPPFYVKIEKRPAVPFTAMLPFGISFGKRSSKRSAPRFASTQQAGVSVEALEQRQLLAADILDVQDRSGNDVSSFVGNAGAAADTASTNDITPTITGTYSGTPANDVFVFDQFGDEVAGTMNENEGAGTWTFTPDLAISDGDTLSVMEAAVGTTSYTVEDAVTVSFEKKVAVAHHGSNTGGFSVTASQLNDNSHYKFNAAVVPTSALHSASALAAFDVVVIGGDGLSGSSQLNDTSFANALSDWVEVDGGGVVMTGFGLFGSLASPSFKTAVDDIIPVITNASFGYSGGSFSNPSPHGGSYAAAAASHFINVGVSGFGLGSGSAPAEWENTGGTAVDSGATLVGTLSGRTVAAAKEAGDGKGVWLGPAYTIRNGTSFPANQLRSGSADRLLENAVYWASDSTAPTAEIFARETPSTVDTNSDTLVFDIRFSEDVTGVDANDFDIVGTSATGVLSAVSGLHYTLTVSGGDLPSLDGTVSLNLASGATIEDTAGNDLVIAEPAIDESYNVDNTAPTAPTAGDQTANNETTEPTITGTATLLAGESLSVTVGGATYDNVTVSGGSWSIDLETATPDSGTLSLTETGHTITATVADAAGNTAQGTGTLTIDNTDPTVPTADDQTANNETTEPTITGTATLLAGESLSVTVGGATYDNVTVSSGNWSIDLETATPDSGTLSLASEADYTVTATVTDAAGNTAQGTGTLTIDNTDPTIPTVNLNASADTGELNDDDVTAEVNPQIAVTGEPDATVFIDWGQGDGPETPGGIPTGGTTNRTYSDGAGFDTDGYQSDGNYTITVYLVDAAGNQSPSATLNVTIDTSVADGSAAEVAGDSDYSIGETITFEVTFAENVFVDETDGAPTLTLSNGASATYSTGSGTPTLSFNYTVTESASEDTDDLEVTGLVVPDNSTGDPSYIRDIAGNDADITLPTDLNIEVDTATITIDEIEGNDVIDDSEDIDVVLSGTTTGIEVGQSVTITIEDSSNAVVFGPETTQVQSDGSWVLQPDVDLSILDDEASFTLKVSVSDQAQAPNTVTAERVFTTDDNSAPQAVLNVGLTVSSGQINVAIGNTALQFADGTASPAQIVFTVTTAPAGTLWLDADGSGSVDNGETALGVNDTFTQADIDADRLKYTHDGATDPDGFDFTVSDALGNVSSTQSFAIDLGAASDSSDRSFLLIDSLYTFSSNPYYRNAASQGTIQPILDTGEFDSGQFLNLYNVSSSYAPPLSFLKQFDAVIVSSWYGLNNSIPLGNVLASYVDAGFGVVEMGRTAIGSTYGSGAYRPRGAWTANNFNTLTPIGSNNASYGSTRSLGTVFDTTHPIMEGVTSFQSRFNGVLLPSTGNTTIANYNVSSPYYPLVVENTSATTFGSIVALNFQPQSYNYFPGHGWNPSTQGGLLMANALSYVAPDTSVSLSGNTLSLSAVGDVNDDLSITSDGSTITITDPTNRLAAGAGTLVNPHTLNIPVGSIDTLVVDTGDGNDTVTLDVGLLDGLNVVFNGGTGGSDDDRLIINGSAPDGTFDEIAFDAANVFTTGNDDFSGTIVFTEGGSTYSTISYTGLEPIVVTPTATVVTIDLSNTDDVATLGLSSTSGLLEITNDNGTFEDLTFTPPTGTGKAININLDSGDDDLTIEDIASAYSGGELNVDGGAGSDDVIVDPGATSGDFTFDGGESASDNDTLEITGGNVSQFAYTFDDAATNTDDDFAGDITLTGTDAGTIRYTGLEPVIQSTAAADVVLTLPDGDTTSTLSATANPNEYILSSGDFEDITFTLTSSGNVTINGGSGTDVLNLSAMDLPGDLDINLGAGDTLNVNGDLLVDGALNMDADTITATADVEADSAISIIGRGNVTLQTVTASNDAVKIQAGGTGPGNLLVDEIVGATNLDLDADGTLTIQTSAIASITMDLFASGDITVDTINPSATGGVVMESTGGRILSESGATGLISGGNLNLTADQGIDVRTNVLSVDAENASMGAIEIAQEVNSLTLNKIDNNASGGSVVITNTQAITTSVSESVSADGGNISIESTNNSVTISQPVFTTGAGTIALTATGGVAINGAAEVTADTGAITITADSDADDSGSFTIVGSSTYVSTNNATDNALVVTAADMTLGGLAPLSGGSLVSPSGRTQLLNSAANQTFTLGSGIGSHIKLTAAELDQVTADSLKIGKADSGAIEIKGAIAPVGTSTLILETGSTITDDPALPNPGSITETNLKIVAGGTVDLDGANDVDNLVAAVSGSGNSFTFNDLNALTIPSDTNAIDGTPAMAADPGIVTNGGAVTLKSESLTIDSGIDTTTDAVVTLIQDNLDVNATVDAGTADINIRPVSADTVISLGGADATGTPDTLGLEQDDFDNLFTSGFVRIGASAALTIGATADDVPVNNGNISFDGFIEEQLSPVNFNKMSLITEGAVVDNFSGGTVDLFVDQLAIRAGSGIGTLADAIDVQTDLFSAVNSTSGDIHVRNETRTDIGTVDTLVGVTNSVSNGQILFDVDAAGDTGQLIVRDPVTAADGDINISTDGSVTLNANGDISSGGGNVSITTNTSSAGTDPTADGLITMSDGTVVDAGSGTIALNAYGNVALGRVITTNNTASAVLIDSSDGAISEVGDTDGADIEATGSDAVVTLNAATGIGTMVAPIDTDIAKLVVSNSASGDVYIEEANSLKINGIDQDGGLVNVKTLNGFLDVVQGTGVSTTTGSVTLTAEKTTAGSASIVINDPIQSDSGAVVITASDSVSFGAPNTVSTDANVSVTATGQSISMNNGALINAGSGLIDLSANGNITLGGLLTTNTTAAALNKTDPSMSTAAIVVITATGSILDAGDTHLEVSTVGGSPQGGAVLIAELGSIGATGNPLEMNVGSIGAKSLSEIVLDSDGDILIDCLISDSDITVTAGGTINDLQNDALADLDAGGTITLEATTGIGGNPGTPATVADAAGRLELAAGNTLIASTTDAGTANGDILLAGLGDLTLQSVTTANGAVDVTAAGKITATLVETKTTNSDANDITLVTTAGGDIEVVALDAGADGDITLTAAGAITEDGMPGTVAAGDVLTASAAGAITLDTNVNSITATTSAAGDIDIDESTGVELTNIATNDGTVNVVAATGDVTIVSVTSAGTDKDVTIEATAGSILDQDDNTDVDITATGEIILTAGANIHGTGTGTDGDDNRLEVAAGSIVTANSTTAGNVRLTAPGAITLKNIDATSGDVDVTTTTGGDILIGAIDASGTVTLNSSAAINDADDDLTADITATTVSLEAVGDIGGSAMVTTADTEGRLEIAGGSVSANSTGTGDIVLRGTADITFTSVTTNDGLVDVDSTGNQITVAGTGISAVGGGIKAVAAGIKLSANLQTDGDAIDLNGPVVIDGNRLIDTKSGDNDNAGLVLITGTIDGMDTATNTDVLTINATADTNTAGAVTITGIVGGTTPLDSIDIDGAAIDVQSAVTVDDGGIDVNGSGIQIGGNLTTEGSVVNLTGPVTLTNADATTTIDTANTSATGGVVTIDGTVDGSNLGSENLVIDTSGTSFKANVFLKAAVGGTTRLGGLDVTADTLEVTGDILTDSTGTGVDADGEINFVNVTTLDLTDGQTIEIDSDAPTGNSDAGQIILTGAADLDINEPTVDLVIDARADGTGDSKNVTLNNVTVKSLNVAGDKVTFEGLVTIKGRDGAGNSLRVDAKDVEFTDGARIVVDGEMVGDTGNVLIAGKAGDTGTLTLAATGTDALPVIDVTDAEAAGGTVTIDSNFTVVELCDDIATAGGAIAIHSPVELCEDVTLDTTGNSTAAGANITISNTITDDATGGPHSLDLIGGTGGDVNLTGNITIGRLDIQSANIVDLPSVSTDGEGAAGGIDIGSTAAVNRIDLNGATLDSGANDPTVAGAISLNSADIDLAASVTLDATTSGTTDGAITIGDSANPSAVDASAAGAEGLTIESGDGALTVHSDLGDNTRLGAVDVNSSGGTITWNGDIATQGGAVDFTGVTGAIDVTGNDGAQWTIDTNDGASGNGGNIDFGMNATITADGVALVFDATASSTDADVILPASIAAASVDVDADQITAGDVVTTGGNIDLNATATTGTAIFFNGSTIDTTNGGTEATAGLIVLTSAGGNLLLNNAGGTVSFITDATTTDANITIAIPVEDTADEPLTLTAGDAEVAINETIGADDPIGLLTINADNIIFDADVDAAGIAATGQSSIEIGTTGAVVLDVNNVQSSFNSPFIDANVGSTIIDSTGGEDTAVLFRPLAASDSFDIGDDTIGSSDRVSDAAIASVQPSVGSLQIGYAGTQSGLIQINGGSITAGTSGSGVVVNTNLIVHADTGGAGGIVLTDDIDASSNGKSITFNLGSSNDVEVNGDLALVTDDGGSVTINGDVLLASGASATLTIDSDQDSDGTGGSVTVSGLIRDFSNAGDRNIAVTAGDGDITLGGTTSDSISGFSSGRFGSVSLDTTGVVVVNSSVTATQVVVGAADTPSAVTFNESLDLDNGAAGNVLDITVAATGTVTFAGDADLTTANGGNVDINSAGAGGSVTINDTAAGSWSIDGSVNIDGNFGNVDLGEDITTNGGAISISSPTTLTKNIALDTTASGTATTGANISLAAVTASGVASAETVTMDAGTDGDISVTGQIGANRLGLVTITNANDVVFDDTANNPAQVTGLTVTESSTFTAAEQIDTTADISIVADDANSPDLATTTSVTLTGGVELGGANLAIQAASDVVFSAPILSTPDAGTETVTVSGITAATEINLGDAGGGLDISEASLAQIQSTVTKILIGEAGNQTGKITVADGADNDGTLTVLTALTLEAAGASGAGIDVQASITTAGNFTVEGGNGFSVNATSVTITTAGGDATINDTVTFATDGNGLAINTTGTTDGAIDINGSVEANNTGAQAENLTLTAGTGDVTLGGTGDTFGTTATADDRLGTISIVSANDVTVNASIVAQVFDQDTGNTGSTTTFKAAVDLDQGSAGDVLRLDDVPNVTFEDAAAVTTANGGNVFLDGDNTGDLIIGTGGMTLDGSFTEQQYQSVQLNGTITANGINISSKLELSTNLELTAATGDISVGNICGDEDDKDAIYDVTITATDGTVSVGQIGIDASSDDINEVTLTGSDGVTLNGNIFTGEGDTGEGNATGNVSIVGAATLGADILIDTTDTETMAPGSATGNAGSVSFSSTINGTNVSGESLTIIADDVTGDGAVTLSGAAGVTKSLEFVDIAGAAVQVDAIQTNGLINLLGSSIKLSGNLQTDGGSVELNGPVTVNGADIKIDTELNDNEDAGTVTINGTINGMTADVDGLTIDATTTVGSDAAVTINGVVGGGALDLDKFVIKGDAIDLKEAITVHDGGIDVAGSTITLNDNL
ncbi:Ig-like domain-containing protein, partial [Rhodopirellula baltica]